MTCLAADASWLTCLVAVALQTEGPFFLGKASCESNYAVYGEKEKIPYISKVRTVRH